MITTSLSIGLVEAQAREDISPGLSLIHNKGEPGYSWVFQDGELCKTERVEHADKIRDLKLAEWLEPAKRLMKRVKRTQAKNKKSFMLAK